MNDEIEMLTVTINDRETEPMTFDQIYVEFLVGYGDILPLDEFKAMCNARGGFTPHGCFSNNHIKFVVLEDTILFFISE